MSAFGISDAEWQLWLRTDGERRVVLAEVESYVDGVGAVKHYLSTHEFVTRPSDAPASVAYDPRIVAWPEFDTKLSELTNGRSSYGLGDLELDNSDGQLDGWLEHGWDGRQVRLLLGSEDWKRADFRPIMVAVVADINVQSKETIVLRLRDRTQSLNAPIQNQLIGGTTINANLPVPLCFGTCFNVEPVLITAASHTYQVHDGAVSSITAVRDNGVAVSFTPNLAAGTFTLATQPAGVITADVVGFYPTASAMIQHIVTTRAGFLAADLDVSLTTTLASTCPQTLGMYIRDRRNTIDVLDEIVTTVGAWWSFDRSGKMRAGRLDAPAGTPVLELTPDDIEENQISLVRREVPPASIRLGYAKNWTVQSEGLAGAVTEANRALYGAEGGTVKAVQSVAAKHLLASNPDRLDTLFALQAEAQTEVDRRIALRNQIRLVVRFTAFASPLSVRLGDVVKVTHPRYGFSLGQLAVVIGLKDRTLEDRVEMELWL